MTSFFSSAFVAQLGTTPAMIDGAAVKAVLFRQAPVFEPNDARYTGMTTISQLLASPGWIPANSTGAPLANTVAMGVRKEGKNNYVMFSQFPFTNLPPNEVMAVAFLMPNDTLIFVTNTPFGEEMMVVQDGDAVTAAPDAGLSGAANRWLFSWADPPQVGGTIVSILEGPLMISLGPPDFEPSHAQHVWLYPQRSNMIANPSFEKPGLGYWGTNGAASRVPLTDKPVGAGSFAGKFSLPDAGVTPAYLDPSVGTISTPDVTMPAGDITWIFRVQRGTGATPRDLCGQWGASGQQSYYISHVPSTDTFSVTVSATGTTTPTPAVKTLVPDEGEGYEWFAISYIAGSPSSWIWWSNDGNSWGSSQQSSTTSRAFFNATGPIVVGNREVGGTPWQGRIYSIECRTGNHPWFGTVLWHFDANDYPGEGTSYTDPRGRTWTLTAEGAIKPSVLTPLVVESNIFPTGRSEQWTIQFMAKGTGKVKVGFVWWDDDFEEVSVDWGQIIATKETPDAWETTETWELNPDVFIHIATCRAPVQTYQGLVRIECDGGDITIDQVLCERGFLKDWNYFDGDTTYGAREDFVWYGGENRQGASYSLWYNNKRAVFGRLFAREIEDDTLITDEVMTNQGFVYRWVPAGTLVIPHIDVLYPNDLQLEIPAKTGVLSYRVEEDDYQGVRNPWV